MKYYKNLCGKQIDITLFGFGRIKVSADAQAVLLKQGVADAINTMVFPNIVLEEVAGDFESPLVDPQEEPVLEAIVSDLEDVDIEDEGEIKETYEPADEDYTVAELKNMCDGMGIKYSSHATKVELHAKVFGV